MKHLFWTLTAVLLGLSNLYAGNGILETIEQKGKAFTALEGHFTQVKTIAANGREITSEGTLYYAPDKFAMHYNPATELLVINGNDFLMLRGNKKKLYNTQTNKVMGSLRNTLLMCMSGDLQRLADENGADIAAQESGSQYKVTLTARQKAARGYATILLSYDKATGCLLEMTMNEFNGNSTVYKMSRHIRNGQIAPEKFAIPAK